jgi:hypothetical protein
MLRRAVLWILASAALNAQPSAAVVVDGSEPWRIGPARAADVHLDTESILLICRAHRSALHCSKTCATATRAFCAFVVK